jgi:radical SAM superfamily enzyme YgiQ (UPF0313 family)
MVDLAGFEVFRKKRGNDAPLIIGGGPSCLNPLILSEFLDLIVIGEAEEVLPELLNRFHEQGEKEKFLETVCNITGVYVPGKSKSVKRAFAQLDNTYYPTSPPVALVDIPHNRLNIEINRGCRNNCRFCQASVIYSPYRQKNPAQIMEAARKSLAATGHDEVVLTSLSATDHENLLEIMNEIHYSFRDLGVSVVMSSMRPENFHGELSNKLARLKKGGITFAPETPSNKLKMVINKNIKNEDIINAAESAAQKGWDKIKLYFMVGLPGETMDDIEQIIQFIKDIRKKSGLKVNVTISPLTPQPHTPFQWLKSQDPYNLDEQVKFIKKKVSANIKSFNIQQYILENIMVRADNGLSTVVYTAWKKGARFDQWGEYFNFELWEEAFGDNGMKWEDCYYKDYECMDELPWDMVDVGIKKGYLKKSYEVAMRIAKGEEVVKRKV